MAKILARIGCQAAAYHRAKLAQLLARPSPACPYQVCKQPLHSRQRFGTAAPLLQVPSWRVQPRAGSQSEAIKPGTPVEDIVKRIGKDDVTITFARSGGAGGQNVNKVNTKVDMRINIAQASWLSEDVKDTLTRLEKKRINKEGELVFTSTRTRSQADNVEDALEKLQSSLDRAAESLIPIPVDPEKQKQMAKQRKIANVNRLEDKKKKSQKKGDRRAKIEW